MEGNRCRRGGGGCIHWPDLRTLLLETMRHVRTACCLPSTCLEQSFKEFPLPSLAHTHMRVACDAQGTLRQLTGYPPPLPHPNTRENSVRCSEYAQTVLQMLCYMPSTILTDPGRMLNSMESMPTVLLQAWRMHTAQGSTKVRRARDSMHHMLLTANSQLSGHIVTCSRSLLLLLGSAFSLCQRLASNHRCLWCW